MGIRGLDDLAKQLDEAQRAISALEGNIGTVNFNPNDPASMEAAIQQVSMTIDERVGAHARNPMVAPIVEKLKETYRIGIIEKAAAARLKATDK